MLGSLKSMHAVVCACICFYHMGLCMPMYIRDYSYKFCVCVSLRSVCLGGLTGERGLNLNAGHCADCRFRFCLSALLCAQDENPSNMARIPIKSNNLLPPTAIEARQLRGDRCLAPVDLAGDPAKSQFPHFYVFEAQIVLSIRTGTKLTRALG